MHPVQKPGDCAKLRLRFILHIRQANAATLTVFNNSAITKDRARQDSVMLSKDEAISFVTDVLKLSAAKRKEEPLLFIGELIKAFQVTEPFQSITLIATAPESRHRPTLKEIKKDMFTGKGGLCYNLNVFMKYLLEALEYDVCLLSGSIKNTNNHVLVMVANLLTPKDMFLIDVGLGYPFFEPIPLNFEKESPVYLHSFVEFKFIWENEKLLLFMKSERNLTLPENMECIDGWKKVVVIDLTPKPLSFFDGSFDDIYTDLEGKFTPFHHSIRSVRYTAGPNMKAICIKESSILHEDDSHCLKETKIESADNFLNVINQNYPSLNEDAATAIKHLSMFT